MCTSCRAKAQAPKQPLKVSPFREEGHDVERIAVRSDVASGTDVSMMKLDMSSLTSAKELSDETDRPLIFVLEENI